MPGRPLFVPTNASGEQRVGETAVSWPLPGPPGEGQAPGDPVDAEPGAPIELLDGDALLDRLEERIFTAEVLEAEGDTVRRARLTKETGWNQKESARFALDCAEHVVGDWSRLRLPSGASLAEILAAAREAVERQGAATAEQQGLLQRLSRLALARRLRGLGRELGDLALQVTLEDEVADLDALDDPAWTAMASIRDAVLAAVEAVRHHVLPRLLERESEPDARHEGGHPEVLTTPWGNLAVGERSAAVPGWVAARDAAERARQAAADRGGTAAEEEERLWQAERLAQALGAKA